MNRKMEFYSKPSYSSFEKIYNITSPNVKIQRGGFLFNSLPLLLRLAELKREDAARKKT